MRQATPLDPDVIARNIEVAPAQPPTPTRTPAAGVPHETKDTIAPTIRQEPWRYRRLVAYASGFGLRKPHPNILVETLAAALDQGTE